MPIPPVLVKGIKTTVVNVSTSATKLPTTPLADRAIVVIQNLSSSVVYIGTSTVTSSGSTRGFVLPTQYSSITIRLTSLADIYGIVGASTADVLVMECR
jgi:hypothetical protein